MNNIINKFLLTADKFTAETHLRDFKVGTYSACGPFVGTKTELINSFKQVIQLYIQR